MKKNTAILGEQIRSREVEGEKRGDIYESRADGTEKVIIWGLGKYGKKILFPLLQNYNVKVIAYTDSNEQLWGKRYHEILVVPPEEIKNMDFDEILITVNHPVSVEEIKKSISGMGIAEEKICDVITDAGYLDLFYDQRFYWIRDFSKWVYEKNISGNVAECGVFRGESAKFLNYFFPDRQLYLFDTFEGFSGKDLQAERQLKNENFNKSIFANTPIFDETDVAWIMKKMTNPEMVIVKQGYFPDSASDVEDRFCLVNLDMDLYIPMLNGLRFFWDRVETGGCIMLHDYFNEELPGVKLAVREFEQERGLNISKIPVGDSCSLVLLKE